MAYIRLPLLLAGIIGVLLLTGCEDNNTVASQSVANSQISVDFEISNESDNSTFVAAQFWSGSNIVVLTGGDRVITSINQTHDSVQLNDNLFEQLAALSDEHHEMTASIDQTRFSFLGLDFIFDTHQAWYHTRFDNVRPGDRVYISFYRRSGESAPNSYVIIPDGFEFTQPVAGSGGLYSRSLDQIDIAWTPSGSGLSMSLYLAAHCLDGSSASWSSLNFADSGTLTVPAGAISGLSGDCTYTLQLVRSAAGVLASKYQGGTIQARQVRSVNVNTIE